MKKISIVLLLTCICLISLFGCNGNESFHTVLYLEYENDTMYTQKEDARSYDYIDYVDQTAPTKRQLELFGDLYNLTYSTSTRRARSDLFVHVYTLDEVEKATVQFDVQTGEIVKCSGIPFTHSMTEEQQYIHFISNLLKDRCHLADYDYSCTTHYYKFYDEAFGDERPGMESKTIKEFKTIDEAQHEKLGGYIFYFQKTILGYKTNEHIAVEIDNNSINLEVYDFDYTDEDFQDFLKSIEAINGQVTNYLWKDVKEEYAITNVEIEYNRLFLFDGNPHVTTVSIVSYTKNGKSQIHSTQIETITTKN